MLPDPGVLLLVARERLDRGHQQPGSAAWPQPQVGVEQHAGRGAAGEPVVEALREPRVRLGRLLVRIVVQKDDVEVRGIAELLAAQLAVADHRKARRAFEMPAAQLAPDLLQRDREKQVRQRGQVVGEPLDAEQPGQILREQPEHLRLVHLAQQIHAALGVALVRGELGTQLSREGVEVRRRVKQSIVEQLVEQQRVARHELGRPARGADDPRDALERMRILGQQGEVGGAARDRFDEIDAAGERGLRIGGGGACACERRHQHVEPAPGLGRKRRVALTGAQCVETPMLGPRRGLRIAFGEYILEMARDRSAHRLQACGKSLPGSEARHLCQPRAIVFVLGQVVALRVVEVLQPVLDLAQESVGVAELARGFGRQQAPLPEPLERFPRSPGGERRVAPAADELQGLRHEFDLADTPRAELDMVGELAPRHLAAHFGV